jgi:hypothetical protein
MMNVPAYTLARAVAPRVKRYLDGYRNTVGPADRAALDPDIEAIEAIIDAAFWASLQHEEGHSPRISLAFLAPQIPAVRLTMEHTLPLDPGVLTRLAPAVERPGIHLGIWKEGADLRVWGAVRTLPPACFVLEVVSPGLLVIKHSRGPEVGKFANIAVLDGNQIKMLDPTAARRSGIPGLLKSLLELDAFPSSTGPGDVMVRLAISMRGHGHGGALLVVPQSSDAWRSSIAWPIPYAVVPPFSRLAELMRVPPDRRTRPEWHDELRVAIEGIAGMTAVDGATVITDQYEVLAFGAMIGRRDHRKQVEEVLLNEPVEDDVPLTVAPAELGGTRHQSAAQFVRDQRDTVALVASEDGRFSLFAWLGEREMVQVYRLDALLL